MIKPLNLAKLGRPTVPQGPVFLSANRLHALQETAHKKGYCEGRQAAMSEGDALNGKTLNLLAENIQNFVLAHADARTEVLKSLAPLIETMVNSILPEVAKNGLADLVAQEICSIAGEGLPQNPTVFCAPENVQIVKDAVAVLPRNLSAITVAGDATLEALSVSIRWPGLETIISPAATIRKITAETEIFLNRLTKDPTHG